MWLAISVATSAASNSLPMPTPGHGGVVGDHGEVALALPDQFVDQALGRADAHEAADHHARAVGDHRDGFFDGNGLHAETPVVRAIGRDPSLRRRRSAGAFDLHQGLCAVIADVDTSQAASVDADALRASRPRARGLAVWRCSTAALTASRREGDPDL